MTVGTATEPLLRLSYVLMLVEAMTHARSLSEKIAALWEIADLIGLLDAAEKKAA